MINPIIAILLMAVVTYLTRVIPLIALQNRIESPFIRQFLYYLPYAILTAMIVPDIFSSTGHSESAIAGCIAALILGWLERSLITVSIGAVVAAYLIERFFL